VSRATLPQRLRQTVGILLISFLIAGCHVAASDTTPTTIYSTTAAFPSPSPVALTPTATMWPPSPTPTFPPSAQPAPTPTPVFMSTPPAPCPPAGAENYPGLSLEITIPEIVLERGTLITVTTNNDAIDGDISSVQALLDKPGPDGLSLREALEATNNDPGIYTIRFAPQLTGTTIELGHWLGQNPDPLPTLKGGSVIINGDTDGDMQPDITLTNSRPDLGMTALQIASGGNTLHALAIEGFSAGIILTVGAPHSVVSDNVVSHLVIRGVSSGIALYSGSGESSDWESYNHWSNTLIISNNIEASTNGIAVGLHHVTGNVVEGIKIVHNAIRISQKSEVASYGINLGAGFWPGADENTIIDALITDNTIEGNPDIAIQLQSGAVGSGSNRIENVQITGNHIRAVSPGWEFGGGKHGIALFDGDGSTADYDPSYLPVAYSTNNLIRGVWIIGNQIEGVGNEVIWLIGSCCGSSQNRIMDVYIIGNTVKGVIAETGWEATGIALEGAGGGGNRRSFQNVISNIVIHANTIQLAFGEKQPPSAQYASGGILIWGGGWGADDNTVSHVWITANQLDSTVPGIHLIGGINQAEDNRVSQVEVWCNTVSQPPTFTNISFPNVRGIHITGGVGEALRNRVEGVHLIGNVVAGLENDISVILNLSESASENTVDDVTNSPPKEQSGGDHSVQGSGWIGQQASAVGHVLTQSALPLAAAASGYAASSIARPCQQSLWFVRKSCLLRRCR
jgi:hypothetical protein